MRSVFGCDADTTLSYPSLSVPRRRSRGLSRDSLGNDGRIRPTYEESIDVRSKPAGRESRADAIARPAGLAGLVVIFMVAMTGTGYAAITDNMFKTANYGPDCN